MQWPIDTSVLSFMGSLPPEPVFDRQTWQQETGVNGEPLYSMELMCFCVSDCSVDAGHGLNFEAARVEPLGVAGRERSPA